MSTCMRRYFERLLKQQLVDVQRQVEVFVTTLNDNHEQASDIIDQGIMASVVLNDTTTYEHYRQLIQYLEAVLRRLRDGYFGYCLETGKAIGMKRLLIVPLALTIFR